MDAQLFGPQSPGRLLPISLGRFDVSAGGVPEVVEVPAKAFSPDSLPPKIDLPGLKAGHFERFTSAQAALGRVNGIVANIQNADTLLRALWLREAKLSSEIENIHTTALDMVLAGSAGARAESNRALETWNAVRALEAGLNSEWPYSSKLIREMHRALLSGVRGQDQRPGEFRDIPAYIGPRNKPEQARFVPPPPGDMPGHVLDCVARLENFVNRTPSDIPSLAAIAMAHYQFETIHPFRDGNGRIGRALIILELCRKGLLDQPVVFLSGYFERNKQRYVDLLFRVSTEGAWHEWVGFFLDGIVEQCVETTTIATSLLQLRESYIEMIRERGYSMKMLGLVDHLFNWPIVTAKSAVTLLGVTDPTARKYIGELADIGVLRPTDDVRYGQTWYAPGVLDLIEGRA